MMYPKSLAKALSKYPNAPINTPSSYLSSSATDLDEDRDLALSFIARCLTLDPKHRPSARELLRHPWIRGHKTPRTPSHGKTGKKSGERSLGVSDRVDKGDVLYSRVFS